MNSTGRIILVIGFIGAFVASVVYFHRSSWITGHAISKRIFDERGAEKTRVVSKQKFDDGTIRGAVTEYLTLQSRKDATSDETYTLNGMLVTYPYAQATILICHGFMCNYIDAAFLRSLFPRGRYNFMAINFRAHGADSRGQLCTFGMNEKYDVVAAVNALRDHPKTKDKPIIAYGFSMGAVAAIEAQAYDPTLFIAMILDCPFDSSENLLYRCIDNLKFSVFGYQLGFPGRQLLQRYAFHPYVQSFIKMVLKTISQLDAQSIDTMIYPFQPYQSVRNISIPCFFIHCKNDEKVPVTSIKSVYNGAMGSKSLWITRGRRHFDSYFSNPERYADRVVRFVSNVMRGKFSGKKYEKIIEDVDSDEPDEVSRGDMNEDTNTA